MGGTRRVPGNPPPPQAPNDEADAAPQAAAAVQRTLASMLGYRKTFLSPRGTGGPAWAPPEGTQVIPKQRGNGVVKPPTATAPTATDKLPTNKVNPDTGNSVAFDTRTEDAQDRANRKRRGETILGGARAPGGY